MLIGIAGPAHSGKDTVGDWLAKNKGMVKDSFAMPIKHMLNIAFGWNMAQWNDLKWKEAVQPYLGFSPRKAAQTLGTEWRNALGDNLLWCKLLAQRWNFYSDALQFIAITDVRFVHEQDWIHEHNGIVVRIHRLSAEPVLAHSSENSLDPSKVDISIDNNGTIDQLYADLEYIFRKI